MHEDNGAPLVPEDPINEENEREERVRRRIMTTEEIQAELDYEDSE